MTFSASKYDLYFNIDHTKTHFEGTCKITLKCKIEQEEKNESVIILNGNELVITECRLNDTTPEINYIKKDHLIQLSFPNGIIKNNDVLFIKYLGKLNQIKTFQDKTMGVFKTNIMNDQSGKADSIVISTHCQPYHASRIFPCFDQLHLKAKFKITIETNDRFKVISNGSVIVRELRDGLQIVEFSETPYLPACLIGFSIGDLQFIQSEVLTSSNTITTLRFYSPLEIEHCTFALDIATKYFPILNNILFPTYYPLDKLDFVLLPFLSDMAMENFGMVTFQMDYILLSSITNPKQYQQLEQLIVHEMVHQWIGDLLTFNSWKHLWFNESFATWLANELLEYVWTSPDYLKTHYFPTISQLSTHSIKDTLPVAADGKSTDELFQPQSYIKGVPMLRELIGYVGKENFIKSLDTFLDDYETPIDPKSIWCNLGVENLYNWFIASKESPIFHIRDEGTSWGIDKSDLNRFGDVPIFLNKEKENTLASLLTQSENDAKNILYNKDMLGLYCVSYESANCIDAFCNRVDELNEQSLYKVFQDLLYFINTPSKVNNYHVDLCLKFLQKMSCDPCMESIDEKFYHSISIALQILQKIQRSYINSDCKLIKIRDKILTPLYMKFKLRSKLVELSDTVFRNPFELEIHSQLLFLLKLPELDSEIVSNAKTLSFDILKSLMRGSPFKKVPLEIIGGALANYSRFLTDALEWKKILDIMKNGRPFVCHLLNDAGSNAHVAIQNVIIENIGYVIEHELVEKTLKFVYTNIESTSIEMLLFGFVYNACHKVVNSKQKKQEKEGNVQRSGRNNRKSLNKRNNKSKVNNMNTTMFVPLYSGEYVKDICWSWFALNFDNIARRACRKGSPTSEQLNKTLKNIFMVIAEIYLSGLSVTSEEYRKNSEKLKNFVVAKNCKFGDEMDLKSLLNTVENEKRVNDDGLKKVCIENEQSLLV
ncbi:Tma108p SCDLUD_002824 [Saccharomycodes ludwigii]|uniref:Tma108p n=1 Tax=Saccharomycodes ludwigii TaxID=36035 RepID=UPI001E8398A0|nr:hypothetical protein SCDLUD_002824 [Saccharomycodes ludwigii]KAH3901333.1 hypothetical protein SCDLUD_002824 [Saccharomycodes ludwigii]